MEHVYNNIQKLFLFIFSYNIIITDDSNINVMKMNLDIQILPKAILGALIKSGTKFKPMCLTRPISIIIIIFIFIIILFLLLLTDLF